MKRSNSSFTRMDYFLFISSIVLMHFVTTFLLGFALLLYFLLKQIPKIQLFTREISESFPSFERFHN